MASRKSPASNPSPEQIMPKIYRAEDDNLFLLFDTGEMEHVCDLVKNSGDPIPQGRRPGKGYRGCLAESLTTILLPTVELMIYRLYETGRGANATEFEPAVKFKECIETVALILVMHDDARSYSKEETEELAALLLNSWTAFIAHASAYRMYHDLPTELAKAKRTSKQASVNASNFRTSKQASVIVTKEELLAHKAAFVSKYKTERGWPESAKIEFNIKDSRTIKNRIK